MPPLPPGFITKKLINKVMKKIFITALLFFYSFCYAQNVGIGTTTPTGPLSFPSSSGNKIVLWGDGNTSHYGMGIQGGLFQIYSNLATDNIAFGYGKSSAFTERMRIINAGGDGLQLTGRILLKNGTSPLDLNYGGGVWMYKPDNSALLGFMGVQNNQNMGFYGGPAGWGFTYDAINSRVGIGNNNPNAPLAFPATLGKKITLYPGNTGDVGFAVAGNRLQIYSDNPNADVAIGYDAGGTFNERFAVKPNGALAVNGNTGTAGQVMTSNGAGNAASWQKSRQTSVFAPGSAVGAILNTDGQESDVSTFTVTVTQQSYIIISGHVTVDIPGCAFCANASVYVLVNDPSQSDQFFIVAANSNAIGKNILSFSTRSIFSVGPGNYTYTLRVKKISGAPVSVTPIYLPGYQNSMVNLTATVIPV
jgi:hypothetical protein